MMIFVIYANGIVEYDQVMETGTAGQGALSGGIRIQLRRATVAIDRPEYIRRELAEAGRYVSQSAKSYTTLGMGTDQGRTTNVTATAMMVELRSIDIR
jgi:Sarcosine oxidase A3 domain